MRALIEASANATDGAPDGPGRIHHRVIADHLRSTSFLIADGVLPSNEGRGYVLRRIMRRAMRHAHLLGAEDPVMWRLVPALVAQMGARLPRAHPRPAADRGDAAVARRPASRRRSTAACACSTTSSRACRTARRCPAPAAFRLYDTYGFPLDLTQDALRERGRAVDTAGFDAAMAEQKAKARAAWAGSGEAADEAVWFDLAERLRPDRVPRLRHRGRRGPGARARRRRPPGRDRRGRRRGPGRPEPDALLRRVRRPGRRHRHARAPTRRASTITDVRKKAGLFVHTGRVEEGTLARGAAAELAVDHDRRTRDPRQPLGDPPAARGAAPRPRRPRRPARQPRRPRPAALRLRPPEGDDAGGARRRRGRGQRLRPPEHARSRPGS